MEPFRQEVTVVGGGIIGLSAAVSLLKRHPSKKIGLIEKESSVGSHQTGRNSGVIHSGMNYRPGSLKARLCVQGAQALIDFCRRHRIPHEICGKLIVATRPEELPLLEELSRRALANGAEGSLLGPERIKEIEPSAAGIQGLHVPSAGIVDYAEVARALALQIQERGGRIQTGCRLLRVVRENGELRILTTQGEFLSRLLINCGGLHSDRIALSAGASVGVKIIPFRGEYYELIPEKRKLIRGLLYPVPDPRLPFLGVHLSRRIDGRVEAGPSAVLALKREGYRKTDVSLTDLSEMLLFPGFWRMAARTWRTGLYELYRSFSKKQFIQDVQRLVPAITERDFVPSGSGVRAQAVDRSGGLLDDFILIQAEQMIHVCNAPSPAATASLAIGEMIADAAAKQLSF